jgi:hypothetical protein
VSVAERKAASGTLPFFVPSLSFMGLVDSSRCGTCSRQKRPGEERYWSGSRWCYG